MKKMTTKALALMMSLCLCTPVYAANIDTAGGTGSSSVVLNLTAPTFSVTVPTNLAISVSEAGVVTAATEAEIVNLSHGMVRVTDVAVTGVNDWTIIDFDSDLSGVAVNTKQIGMKINNDVTKASDDNKFVFDQSNWADIGAAGGGNDTLDINYEAILPAQSASANGDTIANVVFTIGWATN